MRETERGYTLALRDALTLICIHTQRSTHPILCSTFHIMNDTKIYAFCRDKKSDRTMEREMASERERERVEDLLK